MQDLIDFLLHKTGWMDVKTKYSLFSSFKVLLLRVKIHTMNNTLLLLLLIFPGLICAQDNNEVNENAVKKTILEFFEGFHKGDTIKMKNTMDYNLVMQTITKTKSGGKKSVMVEVKRFLTTVIKRPVKQRWEEKLTDFRIHANTDIATAWTPYEFYVNDIFSHCGVNVFQLYNDGKDWKIIAITDTRNREGCTLTEK